MCVINHCYHVKFQIIDQSEHVQSQIIETCITWNIKSLTTSITWYFTWFIFCVYCGGKQPSQRCKIFNLIYHPQTTIFVQTNWNTFTTYSANCLAGLTHWPPGTPWTPWTLMVVTLWLLLVFGANCWYILVVALWATICHNNRFKDINFNYVTLITCDFTCLLAKITLLLFWSRCVLA